MTFKKKKKKKANDTQNLIKDFLLNVNVIF